MFLDSYLHKRREMDRTQLPAEWKAHVPVMIKMKETVTSDLWFLTGEKPLIVYEGLVYFSTCNPLGAVSAMVNMRAELGVKPHEFEVVIWEDSEGRMRTQLP